MLEQTPSLPDPSTNYVLSLTDQSDATTTYASQIMYQTGWSSSQLGTVAESTDSPNINWRLLLLALLRWLRSLVD